MLHDWADEYCLTILKHLRVAAGPRTQLVVIGWLMAYACDEPAAHEIPGAEFPVPPKPLLPNYGCANSTYGTDLMVRANSNHDDRPDMIVNTPKMLAFANGRERTITDLRDLFDQAGWKLTAVHRDTLSESAATFGKAIAVPN